MGCKKLHTHNLPELRLIYRKKELTLKSCVKNAGNQTEYLPFGELLVEEHLNSYNSPFKLNGQILDAETGNYYLSQRYFSPKYNLMLSVDPMAEKYPGWSPYAYAMHRPTVLVDPTGMVVEKNPVYDSKGSYRGNTKEGFTGEAIIYDGNKDFSNMSKDELVDNGGTYLSNEGFNSLHPDSRDKIESHVANYNLDDGLNVEGEIKIKQHTVEAYGGLYNAGEGSPENLLVRRGVHKNGSSVADEYFKPTVENLRNLINVHEVKGHILSGLSGSPKDHFKIFEMQINNPQFQNTTNNFKGFHLNHLYNTGQRINTNILGNPKYKSLYYQFGHPFYKAFNK